MLCAPAPDAAWYVMQVIHSMRSRWRSPANAIISRPTVQLLPM